MRFASLLTAAPVALAVITPAAAGGDTYVAAQFISSKSSCQGFEDGVAPLMLTATCDERDEGYRFALGHYFTDIFGLEVGYQDAGEGRAVGVDMSGAPVVELRAPFKAVDFVGTARWEIPATQFTVIGRFGGAYWDYKVRSDPAGLSADNDKVTMTFGAGLEYRWFTVGYDVIRNVGQENLLDPTAPDIKQSIKRISAGLKVRF